MSKSRLLRLSDVRRAFRLVGECQDLGRDAGAWLAHAADAGRGLVDAQVVLASLQAVGGFHEVPRLFALTDVGWDAPAGRGVWWAAMQSGAYLLADDYRAYQRVKRSGRTVRRQRLQGDRAWYASAEYNTVRRPARLDHYLVTSTDGAAGTASTFFNVQRAAGRPAFSRREVRLVGLFQQELARLVGRSLADGRGDPVAGLSPRLRQTLDCLMNGDSEKQVAVRLKLSPHTVHEYVQAIYRRLGVGSRGELFAAVDHRRSMRPPPG